MIWKDDEDFEKDFGGVIFFEEQAAEMSPAFLFECLGIRRRRRFEDDTVTLRNIIYDKLKETK